MVFLKHNQWLHRAASGSLRKIYKFFILEDLITIQILLEIIEVLKYLI